MGIIICSLLKQYKVCIGRHRWAVIDKAYMHHTWRSSHSSDHLFLMGGNTFPSDHVTVLMDVLYLHSSETFRRYNLMANRVLLLHRIQYKCIHKSSERETWFDCFHEIFIGKHSLTMLLFLLPPCCQIPILLTQTEKQMAREVCIAFRQGV
ncbi:hypothetical protein BUALT_Bualt01G0223900 [Buddleja alternifolia]|uniref:Maturase K n=1 Tax=Buddleja alternifolia TaxID=168488 RepID=A0AAV6YJP5_9LAMI|nr:hypothetical protein BUALT_Bualt01G0223900 [Buddleja alternifolia]